MAFLPPAVLGVKEVLSNMKKQQDELGKRVSAAIKSAGLRLLRESQKLVPVDTGNLKASGFVRPQGTGFNTVVSVGYTASYALFVHEAVGMVLKGQPRPGGRGKYWDPQGRAQAKFLEEPARRLGPELRKQLRDACKIK